MRNLQTVRGKWWLYLKLLAKEGNEGVMYSLQSALLAANALAAASKEVVYVMEDLGNGSPRKIYEIAAGGGLPQLKEEAVAPQAVNGPMKLEVD